MYFLYASQRHKKNLAVFFGFHPPQKGPKFQASVPNGVVFQNCGGPPQFWKTPMKSPHDFGNCGGPPQFWKKTPMKSPRNFGKWTSQVKMTSQKNLSKNRYGYLFFCKNKPSKLVKFGLGRSISDLHPPIGGHHPVLYFDTQMTKKYSTAMCYWQWWLFRM